MSCIAENVQASCSSHGSPRTPDSCIRNEEPEQEKGGIRGLLSQSQGYCRRRRDAARKYLPPKKLRFDVCLGLLHWPTEAEQGERRMPRESQPTALPVCGGSIVCAHWEITGTFP